jgi:membrane protease YdiL (CAAX protease family)
VERRKRVYIFAFCSSRLQFDKLIRSGLFSLGAIRGSHEKATMTDAHSLWHRIVVVVRSGIVAYLIALVLQAVWSALIVANLKISPAIPWSVPVIACLVWLAWQYLGGKWWPRSTAKARRRYLRARAVPARAFLWALLAGLLSIVALAGYWIVMAQFVRMPSNVLPDMSKYPWLTTALMIVTASLIGPVMEQAGFWGYGQVILEEEFRAPVAIVILSILFSLGPHPPLGAVLWPKLLFYFFTSVSFGTIALFTNSIFPSLVVHIIGDLTFFTVVWPHDSTRQLVELNRLDAWFWLHVAQAIVFTVLAILAFTRLAKVADACVPTTR